MNWTEGNLARHSRGRARNEVLNRQKSHFAKARSNLLNVGPKQSPITISFLNMELSMMPQGAQNRRRQPDKWSSPSRHSHLKKSPRLLSPLRVAARFGRKVMDDPKSHLRDGELFSRGECTTKERKRPLPGPPTAADHDEKRRRLLSKPDWAGLSKPQPTEMIFQGNRHTASGSKWSKVDRTRLGATKKPHHYSGPYRPSVAIGNIEKKSEHLPRRPKNSSIRIQIGSQEVHNSMSPWSQGSQKRCSLIPQLHHPLGNDFEPSRHSKANVSDDLPRSFRTLEADSRHSHLTKIDVEKHGRIVYASSEIHEPAPLRADDWAHPVLQWSPSKSDGANSVQVEIGRSRAKPSETQVADNQNWLAFVSSSDHGSNDIIPLTRGSSLCRRPITRPAISPGISATESHFELPPVERIDTSYLSRTPKPSTGSLEEPIAAHSSKSSDREWKGNRRPVVAPDASQEAPWTSRSPYSPAGPSHQSYSVAPEKTLCKVGDGNSLQNDEFQKRQIQRSPQIAMNKPLTGLRKDSSNTFMKPGHSDDPSQSLKLLKAGEGNREQMGTLTSLPKKSHTPTARSENEDNEIWKQFIFDSPGNDMEDFAFGEAVRQAALEVRPPHKPNEAPTGASSEFEDYSPMSTEYNARPSENLFMPKVSAWSMTGMSDDESLSPVTISASHVATRGSASPVMNGNDISMGANHLSLAARILENCHNNHSDSLCRSSNAASMAVSSDPEMVNTVMATIASSDTNEEPQVNFRFAKPRTFIGKLADSERQRLVPTLPPTEETGRRSKRRRKRSTKVSDGRADIRGLPDFDDDPIEEFDEE